MGKRIIYLAIEGTSYESSSVIKAFEREVDANDFVERCRQYQLTRPIGEGIPESDEDLTEYLNKLEEWGNNHPGGSEALSSDYFCVSEVELVEWREDGNG